MKNVKLRKPGPLSCYDVLRMRRYAKILPQLEYIGKRNTKNEVDNAINSLKHQDILGSAQKGRSGLGTRKHKSFGLSNEKEKRDAVRNVVRRIEQEKQFLHLAECNQQGQCLR